MINTINGGEAGGYEGMKKKKKMKIRFNLDDNFII